MALKYTEPSISSKVSKLIDQIILERQMPLVGSDVELKDSIGKRPDIIIFREAGFPFCAWETKRPKQSAYQVELFTKAKKYAETEGLPYFVTFNMNTLVLWKTFEEGVKLVDRRFKEYKIGNISSLEEFDKINYQKSLIKSLTEFLMDLSLLLKGESEKILPKLSIDTIFIKFLHDLIESMKWPLYNSLYSQIEDETFKENLLNWFLSQGWTFKNIPDVVEKVAIQFILILINKIMFYDVIRVNYDSLKPTTYKILGLPEKLPKIDVDNVKNGPMLADILNVYYKNVLKIDYEAVFKSDFFDEIIVPDSILPQIKGLIKDFNKYDFSQIGYEVLGHIFESLIPEDDRHTLGQYFTRSEVVDLIVGASITDSNVNILDPSCGAGTFLVRSHSRLKYLNKNEGTESYLSRLWGVDIAKFPAHLTTINLAIKNMPNVDNYPRVKCDDFFRVLSDSRVSDIFNFKGLDDSVVQRKIPKFDAVITNPPYTSQLEMDERYKKNIQKMIKSETDVLLNKQSSIYSYFFLHGSKFLNEGGILGFITSNSWLDVKYGKELQEYFLKNFKIKAIVESQVEKWFNDASVITSIIILEKCQNEELRNNNLIKFVQIEKKLPDVISYFSSSDNFEILEDSEKWSSIDKFWDFIFSSNSKYTKDDSVGLKIFTLTQKELWDEGYDLTKGSYEGSKWGKYIRAPEIFYKVLEKCEDKLIPLKKLATAHRGITTNSNPFFYLEDETIKRKKIEKEFWMHPIPKTEVIPIIGDVYKDKNGSYLSESQYAEKFSLEEVLRDNDSVYWVPNYLIKSPKGSKSIHIDPSNLKYRVLLIHKNREDLPPKILNHIEDAEIDDIHLIPSFSGKKRWYDLGKGVISSIAWVKSANITHLTFFCELPSLIDQRLYAIMPQKKSYEDILKISLNSWLTFLYKELNGRVNLGDGVLDTAVYELYSYPIIDPEQISIELYEKLINAFDKLSKRDIGTVFEEIGSEDSENVSLDNVLKDRRYFDQIFFGEILGLSNEEQLEFYKAIVNAVKYRIIRAKSTKNTKKMEGIDLEDLMENIITNLNEKLISEINSINPYEYYTVDFNNGEGKISIEVNVFNQPILQFGEQKRICNSIPEAIFLKYQLYQGNHSINVPKNSETLEFIIKRYDMLDEEIKKSISDNLNWRGANKKIKLKLKPLIYNKIWISLKTDLGGFI